MAAPSSPIAQQPIIYQYQSDKSFFSKAVGGAIVVGLGGKLLSNLTLATGAFLGVSTVAFNHIIGAGNKVIGLDEKINSIQSPYVKTAAKVAVAIARNIASLKLACMLTTFAGFPVTFTAALILNIKIVLLASIILGVGAAMLNCVKAVDQGLVQPPTPQPQV